MISLDFGHCLTYHQNLGDSVVESPWLPILGFGEARRMDRDTLNTTISDGPIRITMNDGSTYDIWLSLVWMVKVARLLTSVISYHAIRGKSKDGLPYSNLASLRLAGERFDLHSMRLRFKDRANAKKPQPVDS